MTVRSYVFFTLVLAATITGCVQDPIFSDPVLQDARRLIEQGQPDEGLSMLEQAARDHPDRRVYRAEYFRFRDLVIVRWLAQAETLMIAGQYDSAAEQYRRVQRFDSSNASARAGLAQIETNVRHNAAIAAAEKLFAESRYREAEDTLRPVLVENPQHRDARRLQRLIEEKTVKPAIVTPRLTASASAPISLELRDVTLRSVFDVISRAAGLNFVFDKDVRTDQRTALAIQNMPAEDVVRLVLSTNQLEQKIVNDRTIIVFPNTPQKLREYQELVVKGFYLSNADVKQTANMVRTLVKTRDIYVDEKLNLLIIKDTPNAIRLVERLVAAQDLPDPEVMLEVEVLEVGINKLLELGLRWPDSAAVGLAGGGSTTVTGSTTATNTTPGIITLADWLNRRTSIVTLAFTNPLFLLTLRQTDGSTNLLANPRIRVKNRGKARVHIGDRVPVITTTAAAAGGFVAESVSYIDVGLKLEVEPLIHLEDEVAMNVILEVSNIVREVRSSSSSASSTLAYQIGTRNATTALRLRDGETQVLAGLISDEDRRAASRVPGIGNFPVVGRLFSSTSDSLTRTEIILLITPRIVRTLARPDIRSLEFSAGTEASTGTALGGATLGIPVAPLMPVAPPAAPGTPGFPPVPGGAAPQPAGPLPPLTGGPPPAGVPIAPAPAPGTMVPFGGISAPPTAPP